MLRASSVLCVVVLALSGLPLLSTSADAQPDVPTPPAAARIDTTRELHGDRLVDPYAWLKDKTKPEVIAYLEAENRHTDAIMKPFAALERTLYTEMLGRIKQTDLSVPYRLRGYYYYSRTEEGKQYPVHCRKKGSLDAPEEVLLDGNALGVSSKFWALGRTEVSDDSQMLAWTTDLTGYRQYTLQVKNLATGALLPVTRERVTSLAWAADNRTLFYTTEDATTKRSNQLWRMRLGEPSDTRLYEEPDARFSLYLERTRSSAYVLLSIGSLTSSEVRVLPADRPDGTFAVLEPRRPDIEYEVDHREHEFWIRVNDTGRNFRLVTAPIDSPGRANWREVVASRADVMLEGLAVFRHHLVRFERENGLTQMTVVNLQTNEDRRVAFPEAVYTAYPSANPEFDTATIRYSYQSFVTPASVFDYDLNAHRSTLLKQTEVLGGYEARGYATERTYATAGDGAKIPISIVYKRGLPRDGSAALYLSGYGAYGYPASVTFSSDRVSLLDRGVVVALAHVRGGGDLGKAWHDAGRMFNKRNSFTDFVAAAEHLLAERYGARDRLVIEGGSAGGLLMGAVANLRPDLFKAVILQVPFVDVINTMLDDTLPLTVAEFEEWGNPRRKDEYAYMKTYCPYTNIAAKAYPAMLVKTSLNDSQVLYHEPAKYVAKMRATRTDRNPLVFKINMAAGHGGSSGRFDRLREKAFDYAFMLWQMGVVGPEGPTALH